ncbi:VPS4-associated protein 1 [Gloeopeniophorella convolvens]|nr:VPS4-associated protein 1 [Gloeopeniophorella convolvens]
MSFQNIYFKRATATARACYVCNKPTTTCLATVNTVDFVYTCEAHLSDPGFATEIVDPNAPKEVSKEEIARVKAEWEAKEARRKEKAKAKEDDKGGKDGENEKDDGKKSAQSPSPPVPGALPSPTPSPGATTPTHKRYILHRDFYAMRQAEHRRRRQAKQMQELAPRLPGAPRGSLTG